MISENYFCCDLILMDIDMPVMGGIECTRKIRDLEGDGQTKPIFAMCNDSDPAQTKHLLSFGISGCIRKPLDYQALLSFLDQQFAEFRLEAFKEETDVPLPPQTKLLPSQLSVTCDGSDKSGKRSFLTATC